MKEGRRGGKEGQGVEDTERKKILVRDYTRSSFLAIQHVNQAKSRKETTQTVLM